MDLRTNGSGATAAEREAVDSVLGPSAGTLGHVVIGGEALRRQRRHLLLPVLHALQERVGHVSHAALDYLSRQLDVAPADAYGVASAYSMLALNPTPPVVLHVCDDAACRAARGGDPAAEIEAVLGAPGEGGSAPLTWETSPCLGHCEHGSAALVQVAGEAAWRATIAPFGPEQARAVSHLASNGSSAGPGALEGAEHLVPQAGSERDSLRLLRRVGAVDPSSLDSYVSLGGYSALRRALEIGPVGVIREVKEAKLLGRGGAAFPTGVKWEAVARNPVHPHYFVVNADESEPGTFKDRVLVEADPFAVVEAATIAGVTTGSERVYIYVRGEYPRGERRLVEAAAAAERRGLLGESVMGSGIRCFVEVRRGAGAYIAGEETALFNSIEGRRPEPRNKPPFPVDQGLFSKPTGVNNVETLLNVLEVLLSGAEGFSSLGTEASTGTRLFCLSGRVERPGLYEVPLGTSLRSLLELAGGVAGGRPLSSVLLGGAAGVFVGPDELDMPLSFEGARQAGATLGSGVVVVLDDSSDLLGVLGRIARFFRDESCGQCVPCRVGTARQEELLARLASGEPIGSKEEELSLLADLGAVMRDASICGLGQTASSAVESAISRQLVALASGAKEPS